MTALRADGSGGFHPVASVPPESAGDLFDSTEIDEILTLRALALTDQEKREARATDPRAAALLDRLDGLPPAILERMHGAIRYLEAAGLPSAAGMDTSGPWGGRGKSRRPEPGI